MKTFTENWGVVLQQISPTYDEFTIQVATVSGNVNQYALDYAATLHPGDLTYTYRVKSTLNTGVVVLTDD